MDALLHSCYKELEKQNFRLTPQREAMLQVLIQEKDRHLTSYDLYNKAKKFVLNWDWQLFIEPLNYC